jgi:MFS family permease
MEFIILNNSLKKLLAGQTLSVMGSSLTDKALPILLLNLSGGTSLTGLVRSVATLPTLVLTPLLGVWAETAQPRILVWLNVLFAFASVVLVYAVNAKNVGLIVLALILAQGASAAFIPVYNRVLAALTPPGEAEAARTGQMQSIFSRLATASGEGLAPTLVRVLAGGVFFFDAVSFVLSGIIAWTLPSLPVVEAPSGGNAQSKLETFFADARAGLAAVDKGLLLVLVAAFAIWMTEAAVLPALPGAKPVLGWVFATKALVEFATATSMLGLGWSYTNRILSWAGIILGFSSILLASSNWFGSSAAIVGAVLSGIGSNTLGVGVNNRLFYADRSATARVSALVMVATKLAEIAFLLLSTQVADTYGASTSFFGAGILMTVTTLVVFVFVRPRSSN